MQFAPKCVECDTLLLQSSSQNRLTLSGRWWSRLRGLSRKWFCSNQPSTCRGLGTPVHENGSAYDKSEETPRKTPGLYTSGRTPCGTHARTDDAFPLSVRGAYAMAGARPHRAEPGAIAPDEGRCRADPHCTHDGLSRYCRYDHWNFHAVHKPHGFGASSHASR
jgi:hypothetical protein